jgi:hypothetical protein
MLSILRLTNDEKAVVHHLAAAGLATWGRLAAAGTAAKNRVH